MSTFFNIQLSNTRPVQAADYVANALYGYFEYTDGLYYSQFKSCIDKKLKFPSKTFST